MCARYTIYTEEEVIEMREIINELNRRFFHIDVESEMRPTDYAPVLTAKGLQPMRWGLSGFNNKQPLINARAETVTEKPTFSESFNERRCLLPATQYFEYQAIEGQKKKRKIMFQSLGTSVLYMAGLYRSELDNGEWKPRFTILTTEPNDSVCAYHDRMPLILPKEHHDLWLHDNQSARQLLTLTPQNMHVRIAG